MPDDYRMLVEVGQAQEMLRSKLYMEWVALLEAFGYLCLAIRQRRTQSIVWTYLHTEPQHVTQFYKSIQQRLDKTRKVPQLRDVLKLPPKSHIERAVQKRPVVTIPDGDGGMKEVSSAELYRDTLTDYANHGSSLALAAALYLNPDLEYVPTYNKLKHVFPVVTGRGVGEQSWLQPPIKQGSIGIPMNAMGRIKALQMTQEQADLEIKLIQAMTMLGAELMALCLGLHQLEVLYY